MSILSSIWYNRTFRNLFIQAIVLGFIFVCACAIWNILQNNLNERGIEFGLEFLKDTAGFSIIMHLIAYNEQSSYGRVFWVGLLNTLLVSGIGITFATFLGLLIGLARLSSQKLISYLATIYIEIVRNIPLLLQLFIWYFVVLRSAPSPHQSISFFDSIFITNRGIYLPWPFSGTPHLGRFNFEDGINLLPEFLALVIALTIYTAAYIGEIVRMGIISVPKSQKEASLALGLSRYQTLKLVIIPQSMRVILPPLTNQYLNLTKNSSLATAIAYPDLVSVFAGTALNQTGQAVEIIILTMAVYLFISLNISGLMLVYEKMTAWGKS
jgi:general L-amino acid transport system permease protein